MIISNIIDESITALDPRTFVMLWTVGVAVGPTVGLAVELAVGLDVEDLVGADVGKRFGGRVGKYVGDKEGGAVGCKLGFLVGLLLGLGVGEVVGEVGQPLRWQMTSIRRVHSLSPKNDSALNGTLNLRSYATKWL